jgi:HD-like signal output (HDOD) protein
MPVMETGTVSAPLEHIPIDKVVKKITEISSLPHVAMKIMQVAGDPEAGAGDLKALVEGDPSLCTRMLRSVNSAANGLSKQVTNVQQAVSLLGFNQIRNLAMTASVSSLFKNDEPIGTYRRSILWRHMVSVGVCARLIASRIKLHNFEDAFLGGLLHDIGIILEDQHVHPQFHCMLESMPEGKTLTEREREFLGFDHTTLGERVAELWHFPAVARAVIRFHHMSGNCRTADAPVVHCVELANVICTLKGISSVGTKLVRPPMDALKALNMGKADIKVLAEDLERELELNDSLFEL